MRHLGYIVDIPHAAYQERVARSRHQRIYCLEYRRMRLDDCPGLGFGETIEKSESRNVIDERHGGLRYLDLIPIQELRGIVRFGSRIVEDRV